MKSQQKPTKMSDGCKFKVLEWQKRYAETYLDTKFLPRLNVKNLKCEIVALITGFGMAKFLQLSMDGPNTNWNVLNLVNIYLVDNGYKNLIEIGS